MNTNDTLTVPDSFHQTALAFPEQIKQALALVDNVDDAAEMIDKAEALAVYARRIRASTDAVNGIQEGKLRAIAKLAELMPRFPGKGGGRGKKKPSSPPEPGLGKATMAAYHKVGDAENRITEYVTKIAKHNATLPEKHPGIQEMSMAGFIRFIGSDGKIESVLTGNVEWYTPAEYINRARKVMGRIDLDPASNDKAQEVVQADRYYTENDNGLQQAWWGRVFLNPPYKMPLVHQFAEKLCEEYLAGTVKQAVFLTDGATDTHWWQQAAKTAALVCFTEGRIKFYNPSGVGGSPTRGQSFMYFGARVDRFQEAFAEVGWIVRDGNDEHAGEMAT